MRANKLARYLVARGVGVGKVSYLTFDVNSIVSSISQLLLTLHCARGLGKALLKSCASMPILIDPPTTFTSLVLCLQIVALLLDRSFELVISILAVHKTGAAYVPIDPGQA